jgi:hypothetical protein
MALVPPGVPIVYGTVQASTSNLVRRVSPRSRGMKEEIGTVIVTSIRKYLPGISWAFLEGRMCFPNDLEVVSKSDWFSNSSQEEDFMKKLMVYSRFIFWSFLSLPAVRNKIFKRSQ